MVKKNNKYKMAFCNSVFCSMANVCARHNVREYEKEDANRLTKEEISECSCYDGKDSRETSLHKYLIKVY